MNKKQHMTYPQVIENISFNLQNELTIHLYNIINDIDEKIIAIKNDLYLNDFQKIEAIKEIVKYECSKLNIDDKNINNFLNMKH